MSFLGIDFRNRCVQAQQQLKVHSEEAKDFKTLQLMAKREYLLACYLVVVEEKRTFLPPDGNNGFINKFKIDDCNCKVTEDQVDSAPSFGVRQYKIESKDRSRDNSWHHCPCHKDFKPSIDCRDHVECNDPIFR